MEREVPSMGETQDRNAMGRIDERIRSCRRCGLCQTRTLAVPGEGSPHSRILFLGEAPGADEDISGRPFVGRSGRLLRGLISDAGCDPSEVYITNTVKCRPPQNRVPEPAEAMACSSFLEEQLDLLRPMVLVCVGATAVRRILGEDCGRISAIRGRWFSLPARAGMRVLPIFHPSYLLRNFSEVPGGPVSLTRGDIRLAVQAVANPDFFS
jgi:DNA polymerase